MQNFNDDGQDVLETILNYFDSFWRLKTWKIKIIKVLQILWTETKHIPSTLADYKPNILMLQKFWTSETEGVPDEK